MARHAHHRDRRSHHPVSIDFRVNYDDGNEFYGPRLWVDTLDTETGDVVHKTFHAVPTAMRLRDRLARALRSIPPDA
jgi:hypothetical protein